MKNFFLITLLLINYNISDTYFSRTYILNIPNRDISCYVSIYDNGFFSFDLIDQQTIDIYNHLQLSFGQYKIIKDQIIFYDHIHSYTMTAIINKNSLIFIKSFSGLKGIPFRIENNYPSEEYRLLSPRIDSCFIAKEIEDYQNKQNKAYSLYYGLYDGNDNYYLNLISDKNYQIIYNGLYISKGTWSRNKNVLKLFDVNLKYAFNMLIGEDILISKLLPGDYISTEFKLIK